MSILIVVLRLPLFLSIKSVWPVSSDDRYFEAITNRMKIISVGFDMTVVYRDRMGISKQELVSMLEEDELKDAVLVVLANKQETRSLNLN